MHDKMLPQQKKACEKIMKEMQHSRHSSKVVYFQTPVKDFFDLNTKVRLLVDSKQLLSLHMSMYSEFHVNTRDSDLYLRGVTLCFK